LVDDDQSIRLARRTPCRARVNDVADIEKANPGDPVERGRQLGIAQLGLGIFDRRLIGFDRGLLLRDHRLLRGDLLLRRKSLLLQRDIPTEVDPPIFEMGLVAGEIGLGLVELGLIRARIELSQELAFFAELAVLEIDAEDLFRDHAADRRAVQRRDIANPSQDDREIARLDGRRNDRNGRRGAGRAAGATSEILPTQIGSRDNRDDHETDKHRGMSSILGGGSFGCGR